jgi:glycine cleavage system H lipoate-binding protein
MCENSFDCRACARHAEFSTAPALPPRQDMLGFAAPLDRLYHRGHAWARTEPDGTVTVGLDELGLRLIGKPDRVLLPREGARVKANGTAWSVQRHGATVRILAPVDGTVVATGGPEAGWYLKLHPEEPEPDMRHLLRGGEVHLWMMRELDRLQLLAAAGGSSPVLADGGVPVADLGAALPRSEWEGICGEMLLQP